MSGRLETDVTDLGPTQLKNIAEPIRVYSLEIGQFAQAKPASAPAPEKSAPPRLSMVVLPCMRNAGVPAGLGGSRGGRHLVSSLGLRRG